MISLVKFFRGRKSIIHRPRANLFPKKNSPVMQAARNNGKRTMNAYTRAINQRENNMKAARNRQGRRYALIATYKALTPLQKNMLKSNKGVQNLLSILNKSKGRPYVLNVHLNMNKIGNSLNRVR